MKQTILTGLQSSGDLHIGNYFGAMKPFLDLYNDKKDSANFYLMVADYHALTSVRDREALKASIYNTVRDYLAVGVDPEQVTLFRQSDNPDHTEMGWVLNCMVTVPFLMLAHSYKDKVAKGLEANAGLFTYPMLMAADILLYGTDLVPVGEDQRQHLEYTREAVAKFNNAYGEVLKEPKELILEAVGVVPGTDGAKMSKSYKNTIPLFGSREDIQKAVMSIVTDSTGDRPENVYAIHKLFRTEAELETLYTENAGKYKNLKEALIEDIDAFIEPMRAKRAAISDDDVKGVLAEGARKAKLVSNDMLGRVRDVIGITI
ncbi:tryptophan--tRNA ligase [Patescibacteria group bacterium]|nr:tryptophan--tRNA ligase [Patescibacteria group bacterium]